MEPQGAESEFLRAATILGWIYCALAIFSIVVLATRLWAAARAAVPFEPSHVAFVLLILFLGSVRMVDMFEASYAGDKMVQPDGAWIWNFLGSVPLAVSCTVFAMLIYHVSVVVRSIHLAFEPAMRGQCSPSTPRWNVLPCFRFWFVMCGRPRSTLWWCFILFNGLLWGLYFVAYTGSSMCKTCSEWLFTYLLLLPSILAGLLISMGALVSALVLFRDLRSLRQAPNVHGNAAVSASTLTNVSTVVSTSPAALAAAAASPAAAGATLAPAVSASTGSSSAGDAAKPPRSSSSVHQGAGSATGPGRGFGQSPSQLAHVGTEQPVATVLSGETSQSKRHSSSAPLGWNAQDDDTPESFPSAQGSGSQPLVKRQPARPRSSDARSVDTPASGFQSGTFGDDRSALALPSLGPVLSCLRRMLVVVVTCVLAFLFRACVIAWMMIEAHWRWPPQLFLLYMTIAELWPYTVVLVLYWIPGIYAACTPEEAQSIYALQSSVLEIALPAPMARAEPAVDWPHTAN